MPSFEMKMPMGPRLRSVVQQVSPSLFNQLRPKPGELLLDLGCGGGELAAGLAHIGFKIVGVDCSPVMVKLAKSRGIDARLMDARELLFEEEFDVVFSNDVLHWVKGQELAVAGAARALKTDGRFLARFGGHGNFRTVEDALVLAVEAYYPDRRELSRWTSSTQEHFQSLLEARGFEVEAIDVFSGRTPLPNGMRDWLMTFAGSFLNPSPQALRERLLENSEALMKPILCKQEDNWHIDRVTLEVSARKR